MAVGFETLKSRICELKVWELTVDAVGREALDDVHLDSPAAAAFWFSLTDGSIDERLPDHWHRNLKAFEEHIQRHVFFCFITEQFVYNLSGLGVRVVWKLFNWRRQRSVHYRFILSDGTTSVLCWLIVYSVVSSCPITSYHISCQIGSDKIVSDRIILLHIEYHISHITYKLTCHRP